MQRVTASPVCPARIEGLSLRQARGTATLIHPAQAPQLSAARAEPHALPGSRLSCCSPADSDLRSPRWPPRSSLGSCPGPPVPRGARLARPRVVTLASSPRAPRWFPTSKPLRLCVDLFPDTRPAGDGRHSRTVRACPLLAAQTRTYRTTWPSTTRTLSRWASRPCSSATCWTGGSSEPRKCAPCVRKTSGSPVHSTRSEPLRSCV